MIISLFYVTKNQFRNMGLFQKIFRNLNEEMKFFSIQQYLSRNFYFLGKLIAIYPLYFIMGSIVISIILSTGFLRMQIFEDNGYLATNINGKAIQNKKFVEEHFPFNTSVFEDFIRCPTLKHVIIVLILEKNEKSIFRDKILEEVDIVDKFIRNMTITYKGKSLNYSDLCAKSRGKCFENSIIKLLPNFSKTSKKTFKLKYPLDIDQITFNYFITGLFLGGVTKDDQDYVKDAKVLRLFYSLDINFFENNEAIFQWQLNVNNLLNSQKFNFINVIPVSYEGINKEVREFTRILFPLAPIPLSIILIFSFISNMTNDCIRSKPWLGPSACIATVLAVVSGFGLAFHVGVHYADFTLVLAFIILGTEIDDAFIQIAAWRSTNPEDSVEERLGKAYSEAAVSITITSITNIISFCIGTISPFPIIRVFCIYAAIIMFFAYVYQITFFGGCMALSGYREKKNLHCLTFRHIERAGKNSEEKYEDLILLLYRNILGSILDYPLIKIFVLLIFLINLSISVWGLKFLKAGNTVTNGLKYDSSGIQFNDIRYRYFEYCYTFSIIIDRPLNYNDNQIMNQINETLTRFESHPHIGDYKIRLSWLKYYKIFSNFSIGKIILRGYNLSEKQDFINGLKIFLKFPQSEQFKYDIIFNDDGNEIIASRFFLSLKDISSSEIEGNTIEDIYNIAEKSNLPIKVYSYSFPFIEQAFLIKKLTLKVALITSFLICIIFFLFIPNVICVISVAIVVFCMILETVSYMSMWYVNLDLIALITLILCVGFSINYPTHVSFSFIAAKNLNSKQRLLKCLYEIGLPITQGFFTTLLGIILLAFQPFYISLAFFKIVFLICILTFFHSMFVLPVILSYFKFS